MNKSDRAAVTKLHSEIDELKGKLDDIKGQIEELQSAEQDKFDNMSEGLQQGENGKTQHCIGALIMFASDGYDSTPGIDNDDDLMERIMAAVDPKAPVFESVADFLDANGPKES